MISNDYFDQLRIAKLILIIVTILSSSLTIYVIKSSFDEAELVRNEIFVADAQNTLILALSSDMNTNRGNEAKAVVNKLHTHLFYMTPTASAIENAIACAADLSDESVKQFCNKKLENGFYDKMMAEGISIEFVSDSITLYDSDRQGYDFFVRLYGKTSTITSTKIEFRKLVSTCYVQNQDRTIENPSGYRCCFFNIENEDIIRTFLRVNDSIPN